MFLYVCDDIYDVAYRAIVLIHSQDGCWSSLMSASQHNHVEVVKLLIEGGAIVNTQDEV